MSLFTKKTSGTGDTRWLTSPHGLNEAKTEAITVAEFADKTVNGALPSGTAVTIDAAAGTCKPYDGVNLSGFLLFSQSVANETGVINVPVISHCHVDGTFLPEQYAKPSGAVASGITFYTTNWK